MRRWNLAEIAAAVGVSPPPDNAQSWLDLELDNVSKDSRDILPRSLFIALRGEHFDGHDFVQEVVQRGNAVAVIVDTDGYAELKVPVLRVQDTLRAWGALGRVGRQRIGDLPVVGVTGSNGKTTTKELIAAALSVRGPVHKTHGNLNHLVGVPQTLLSYREHDPAWAAVVEIGMLQPGEIAYLSEIAAPTVGLVTCVGPAHLEGLGTVEAIARAKCDLVTTPSVKTAIINADDERLVAAANQVLDQQRIMTFGTSASCDVQLIDARPSDDGDGLRITLAFAGAERVDVALPLVGQHNALNAAGAAAAAFALGLEPLEIARGLETVQPAKHRLRVHRNVGVGLNVVDDSYNSNPASTRAALATMRDLAGAKKPGRRLVAIIGDMFELGPAAAEMHRDIGVAAVENGIDVVYALGPLAEHTAGGAREEGVQGYAFSDLESLKYSLRGGLNAGDWVLVKGSRGMRMERLVDWIARQKD